MYLKRTNRVTELIHAVYRFIEFFDDSETRKTQITEIDQGRTLEVDSNELRHRTVCLSETCRESNGEDSNQVVCQEEKKENKVAEDFLPVNGEKKVEDVGDIWDKCRIQIKDIKDVLSDEKSFIWREKTSKATIISAQSVDYIEGLEVDLLLKLLVAHNKMVSLLSPYAYLFPKLNVTLSKLDSQEILKSTGMEIIARRRSFVAENLSGIEEIRRCAEEKRYLRSVDGFVSKRDTDNDTFASAEKSLAMAVNALVGLFLTFLAGFWGVRYCYGERSTFTLQLVTGLVCSIVCLIVEVLLLIIHDHIAQFQKLNLIKKATKHAKSRHTKPERTQMVQSRRNSKAEHNRSDHIRKRR